MGLVNTITDFLAKLFQWWFLVMPWEQAIRVRNGRRVSILGKGIYFKIPFIDSVYLQTTRMRMNDLSMQTVTSKDGFTITIKSAMGYSISDIMVLYNTLYHPEMTLASMIMGYIGEYIRSKDIADISPESLSEKVKEKINAAQYGLKDVSIKVTSFAIVKTFRLIQDGSWLNEQLNMNPIK